VNSSSSTWIKAETSGSGSEGAGFTMKNPSKQFLIYIDQAANNKFKITDTERTRTTVALVAVSLIIFEF